MKTHIGKRPLSASLVFVAFVFVSLPQFAHAYYIYGDPAPCAICQTGRPSPMARSLSLSEGNRIDQTLIATLGSASGGGFPLSIFYNSYNADGTRAAVNTVMGFGWTHSYNLFLFSQRGHMFLFGGDGRVTLYKLGAAGKYTAPSGYFETLTRNPDGTFTLRKKDGTLLKFAAVPGTPFQVGGPVYQLTSIVDRNGNTTTLAYVAGLLSTVTDTYGKVLQFSYNALKKLATVTDPAARVTTFAYDASGKQLLRVTDPAGRITRYSYNANHQMLSKIDGDSRVQTYAYSAGKPTGETDGVGGLVITQSNPGNWAVNEVSSAPSLQRAYVPSVTTRTDGVGNKWRYDTDANGYVLRQTAPDGTTNLYTYDPASLMVATETDGNGHTTSYQYDANGNRTRLTNALGQVFVYTYEPTFSMMTSATDPKGRVTTYEYDPNGNLIKRTDPLLQTQKWSYDSHGNVLTRTDKRGNVTTYTYDASGNRVSVIAPPPLNYVTTMTYDSVGNLVTTTDPNLHTTSFQYDGLNRIIRKTDHTGKFDRYTYDAGGNRIQLLDRNGNPTAYQYDQRERPIKITDANNRATSMSYDRNDNRTTITDRNGFVTKYEYDVQNRMIKTTDAELNVGRTTYDPAGNVLTRTDGNNHTTTYEYDALNRPTKKTDAAGHIATYEYDTGGTSGCGSCGTTPGKPLVTKQTDGNGKVTYYKYDKIDRLVQEIRKEGDTADIIDASDSVTAYTYDADNNRLSLTEANGNVTAYEYDPISRIVKQTGAAGDIDRLTYDGADNVITHTAPNGNITTYFYDTLNRLTQADDTLGKLESYSYDSVGNVLSQTDGNGNSTDYSYDPVNRVTHMTDPAARTTNYQYDFVGNIVKTTDREGRATNVVYDKINRLRSRTDALPATTQYQYDGVGNLIKITDANGNATSYQYDALDRRVKEIYADPAPNTRTFTYDAVNMTSRTDQKGQVTTYTRNDLYHLTKRSYPVGPSDNMTYDLAGRLLTGERDGWTVAYAYDGANRVTQCTQNGEVTSYVYNIPGRTRTVTYPGGRTITETTDARARLSRIDDLGLPTPLASFSYDLADRVTARTYRNGTSATWAYNTNNWVVTLDHTKGASRIAGFRHDHDKEGIKRYEEKLPDAANSQNRSESYLYDSVYRLVDYKVGVIVGSVVPVPSTQTQYTLDPVANWNVKTRDAVPEARTHSPTNEIVTIGAAPIVSDENGNVSEDVSFRYSYDEENRLTVVTRKSDNRPVGRYHYDALSARVKKIADAGAISNPVETRYYYDGARVIEAQDALGATVSTYVYGNYLDEVLTMDRAGQTFYYHSNTLWSPGAVTDSVGNAVERYAYDAYGMPAVLGPAGSAMPGNPWGAARSAIGNPWMFTGREWDEESGLYYYRSRFFDPLKGRFMWDPLESTCRHASLSIL